MKFTAKKFISLIFAACLVAAAVPLDASADFLGTLTIIKDTPTHIELEVKAPNPPNGCHYVIYIGIEGMPCSGPNPIPTRSAVFDEYRRLIRSTDEKIIFEECSIKKLTVYDFGRNKPFHVIVDIDLPKSSNLFGWNVGFRVGPYDANGAPRKDQGAKFTKGETMATGFIDTNITPPDLCEIKKRKKK